MTVGRKQKYVNGDEHGYKGYWSTQVRVDMNTHTCKGIR